MKCELACSCLLGGLLLLAAPAAATVRTDSPSATIEPLAAKSDPSPQSSQTEDVESADQPR
jgi:hypothetical protein